MPKKWKISITVIAAVIIVSAGFWFWQFQNDRGSWCTADFRIGLGIHLFDSAGNPIEKARIMSGKEKFDEWPGGSYSGLGEGRGKYKFTIEKEGFQTYHGTVNLKHDSCHVIGQTQEVVLKRINE